MNDKAPRRQRKLPSLPHTRRSQEFWPTFRGAIDWMHKNQYTIETALNLLEIYPKLIQHKSCDRLWDFVSKVAFFDKRENTERNGKIEFKNEAKDKMVRETNEIPAISVTDDNKKGHEKIKFVYICGNVAEENWQSLVLGLSERFFVRCSNEKKIVTADENLVWVTNVDAFIFLMDNRTISDLFYLDQLETALAWKKQVTFVRDPSFELPDPLPTSVSKISDLHSLNEIFPLELYSRRATSAKQDYKPNSYRQDARSLSVNQLDAENYDYLSADFRQLKTSRPSTACSRLSFESTLSLNLPTIPLTSTPTRPFYRKSLSDSGASPRNEVLSKRIDSETSPIPLSSTPVPSIPFSDFIAKGYDSAILYHPLYHTECLDRIDAVLREETFMNDFTWKTSSTSASTISDKVMYKNEDSAIDDIELHFHHENSAIGETDANFGRKMELSKETKNINNEKRVSLESEKLSDSGLSSPIETIYAIYSENKSEPELVHWPVRHSNVSGSPSVDSFGFQDVDLSKSVNQLDLTSDDESY